MSIVICDARIVVVRMIILICGVVIVAAMMIILIFELCVNYVDTMAIIGIMWTILILS